MDPQFRTHRIVSATLAIIIAITFTIRVRLRRFTGPQFVSTTRIFVVTRTSHINVRRSVHFQCVTRVLNVHVARRNVVIASAVFRSLVHFSEGVFIVTSMVRRVIVVITTWSANRINVSSEIRIT